MVTCNLMVYVLLGKVFSRAKLVGGGSDGGDGGGGRVMVVWVVEVVMVVGVVEVVVMVVLVVMHMGGLSWYIDEIGVTTYRWFGYTC